MIEELGPALLALFGAAYLGRKACRTATLLTATRLALGREQRLAALGALAAAAHELGSPLSTIAVTAHELSREVPADSPLAKDIALLAGQSERCRLILTKLTHRPETKGDPAHDRLSLTSLTEAAAANHLRPDVTLSVVFQGDNGKSLKIRYHPEIIHGLGNLIQNAMQYARHRVTVKWTWDQAAVTVMISDDGPGFPPALLGRLGRSLMAESGLFIAKTLLGGTGARLAFGNASEGGAQVHVIWPRRLFQEGIK